MVRSVSDDEKKLFPSPVTPSYIKAFRAASRIGNRDACRSFEQYLAEMMVEDGKMRDDLTDAEELVHCWKNLKCPVFIDVVCRFYGELCEDLFAPGDANHV
ncbi:Transcription repressor OFP17 [Linum perenne]